MLGRSTLYDRVSAVVHIVRVVLACSAASVDCISVRVAVPAAVSDFGDRGPRRAGIGLGGCNAPIQVAHRAFSDCGNLEAGEPSRVFGSE